MNNFERMYQIMFCVSFEMLIQLLILQEGLMVGVGSFCVAEFDSREILGNVF